MRDNLRRSRAICHALTQAYPVAPPGHLARHLTTLAALISGMVGSRSTPRPPIATKGPAGTTPESRVKRCARWLGNDHSLEAVSFVPSAAIVLPHVALETVVLVMDGRGVGRGGHALRIHVRSQGRALPLAWRVRQGPQGHGPADLHSALGEWLSALLPEGTRVVLRGDGACDGTGLPQTVQAAGWSSGCRTATHRTAWWDGAAVRLETVGAGLKPGTLVACSEVWWTREAYGPLMRICGWAKGGKAPRYVVSTMAAAEAACRLDSQRFRIETLFSDQKSRGFHRHTSPLSDPQRLSRFLMAACLASMWIVHLGSLGVKAGWTSIIHRRHRCDGSLFQRGLRLLEQCFNEASPIPVAFYIVM